jgi:hypothetical protein
MKKGIKLTEQDVHKIVKETIKNVLSEGDVYDYDANYEQLIRNEMHNLYDLEGKVPYSYRQEIHSMVNTLQGILFGIRMDDSISRI